MYLVGGCYVVSLGESYACLKEEPFIPPLTVHTVLDNEHGAIVSIKKTVVSNK